MSRRVRVVVENGRYVFKPEPKKVYTLDEIAAIRREKEGKK